jgi:hypothetical protein
MAAWPVHLVSEWAGGENTLPVDNSATYNPSQIGERTLEVANVLRLRPAGPAPSFVAMTPNLTPRIRHDLCGGREMPTGIHQLGDVTPYIEQLQSNLTRIAVAIVELDKRNKRLEERVRVLERRLTQQEVTKAERAPRRKREKRLSIADIAMLTMPGVENHQRY